MLYDEKPKKSQEQLYLEALRPFKWGLFILSLDIILFVLMRSLWLSIIILILPFILILFVSFLLIVYSFINSSSNISLITDFKIRKKVKIIIYTSLILSIFLLGIIIYLLYNINSDKISFIRIFVSS